MTKINNFYLKKIIIVFLFINSFLYTSNAQEEHSVFEEFWFQYYNKTILSEKWSISTDIGYRLKEGSFIDVSQHFVRSGIGYQLNPAVRVLLGAAVFKTHTSWNYNVVESRLHQQLTTKHKFGKINFGNRFRIEQRFVKIKGYEGNKTRETFNWRFRYRFLFKVPLAGLSKTNPNRKLGLLVGDEIIFSTGKNEFLDFDAQNRILVGPIIDFNKKNSFFVVLNFTSVIKDIPEIDEDFGILWVGYKQTFDFSK